MSEPVITRNEDEKRYEAHLDGELAGFTEYEHADGYVVMPHTRIFDEFEGKGVGSQLARGALDDLAARGHRVEAKCPFVHGWINRHADYHPLLREGHPEGEVEQD